MTGGRGAALLVWITFLWVELWGVVSIANILGGLLVGLVLLVVLGSRDALHPLEGLRPRGLVPLLRLAGVFVVQLVQANLRVAGEVLRPHPQLRRGIVRVELAPMTDAVATLIANFITLTPGTLSIDLQHREGGRMLYMHVLDLEDADEERERVHELERLVCAAFSGAVRDHVSSAQEEVGT